MNLLEGRRRLFGRRKGRPLSARKRKLLEDLLPHVQIDLAERAEKINPTELFSFPINCVCLEIGFGSGEHLAVQAEKNPNKGYLGCEPFVNGIAKLLTRIEERKIGNIKIFPDDACILIDKLASYSINCVFLLYPDPWPKKRHIKRRFLNRENLDRLARIMKKGAELRIATDVADLALWMKKQAESHPEFMIEFFGEKMPQDWVETRYGAKGTKEGRKSVYAIVRRI